MAIIKNTLHLTLLLAASICLGGCNVNASNLSDMVKSASGSQTVKPSSTMVTRTFNVGTFAEFKVCGGFNVTYNVAENSSGKVTVEMPSNYEEYISVKNTDKELKIIKINCGNKNLEMNKVKVTIFAPACREIDLSGAVTVKIVGKYALSSSLEAEISGASNLSISDLRCVGMDMEVSGASGVKIANANITSVADIECSGASNVKISGGKFDTMKADASGASSIKGDNIKANLIDMEASGASNVKINGQARQVNKSASGASSVKFEVR